MVGERPEEVVPGRSPSSSEAEVGRGVVTGPSATRVVMYREDALVPWRSAERNVELALQLRGFGGGDHRSIARELLDEVGLGAYEDPPLRSSPTAYASASRSLRPGHDLRGG